MLGSGIMNSVNSKTSFKPLAEASFGDIPIPTWLMSSKTKVLEAWLGSIFLFQIVICVVNETTFVTDIGNIHWIGLASIHA
jgi:hypothetical protein